MQPVLVGQILELYIRNLIRHNKKPLKLNLMNKENQLRKQLLHGIIKLQQQKFMPFLLNH